MLRRTILSGSPVMEVSKIEWKLPDLKLKEKEKENTEQRRKLQANWEKTI